MPGGRDAALAQFPREPILESASADRGTGPSRRLRRLAVLGLIAALLACAAPFAYYRLFSSFEWYDDEGYVMVSIASFDRGLALYDEVFTQYGPFFYLVSWLAFDVGGVTLDHATVRILVEGLWLACAFLSAVYVAAVGRSAALSAIACALVFVHLGALVNEPGHPQALAVLLVCVAVALSPLVLSRHSAAWLGVLGLVGAALATTKVNLGVFFFLSVVLALSTFTRERVLARVVRPLAWLAALLLPFAVMRTHPAQEWVQTYAIFAACTVATMALVLWPRPACAPFSTRHLAVFSVAFAVATASILGFALLRGTSWSGLFHGVIGQHLRFGSLFMVPAEFGHASLSLSLGSLALCATVSLLERDRARFARTSGWVLACSKLAFAALVFGLSATARSGPLLAWAGPFLWLTALGLRPAKRESAPLGEVEPVRALLALIALPQTLQAYPVAGSQMSWATLLVVVAATLCLGDAVAFLVPRGGESRAKSPRRALLWRGAATVALAAGLAVWIGVKAARAREFYRGILPLRLPGTQAMRLAEHEVAMYGWLARVLASADAFYTLPGFNSLYFWAQKDPPSALNATVWHQLFSPEQQRSVIASLERHQRVAFVEYVDDPPFVEEPIGDDLPLAKYLRGLKPIGRVGRYELRVSEGWLPEPVFCALLRDDDVLLFAPALSQREGAGVRILDLAPRRRIASTAPIGGERQVEVFDEQGRPIALDPGGGIDVSRPRRLVVRSRDPRMRDVILEAGFPAVRLFDARGRSMVTLPFVR